ncbi:hypothetical protein ACLOJK_035006, partial [Asimina triloba]
MAIEIRRKLGVSIGRQLDVSIGSPNHFPQLETAATKKNQNPQSAIDRDGRQSTAALEFRF